MSALSWNTKSNTTINTRSHKL